MKKIFLILTDTGTAFTRLIKLYTKRPYNHASICFDEHFCEVYSFGRKQPNNPFIGGFVKEDLKNELLLNANCKIYYSYVTNEQYAKMKAYVDCIEKEQQLYKYNLLGVMAYPLKMEIKRDYAMFCSEFVANALTVGDVAKFAKPPSFVSPDDLQSLPNFHLYFEGKISQLFSKELYYNDLSLSS